MQQRSTDTLSLISDSGVHSCLFPPSIGWTERDPELVLELPGRNDVEVWGICLRTAQSRWNQFYDCLHQDELATIARNRNPTTRWWAVVRRGAIRMLLAARLKLKAKQVRIETTNAGRPHLAGWVSPTFSVSQTRNAAVFAITGAESVGVDIEIADVESSQAIQDTVLSTGDLEWVRAAGQDHRDLCALRAWVRKEAMLKALGTGFLIDPRRVCIAPGHTLPGWSVIDVSVSTGAILAVAVPIMPDGNVVLKRYKIKMPSVS